MLVKFIGFLKAFLASSSIRGKISRLGYSNLLGLILVMVVYGVTAKMQSNVQKQLNVISDIQVQLTEATADYYIMAISTMNYLAEPSDGNWQIKEEFDSKLEKPLKALDSLLNGKDYYKTFEELKGLDENYMNPLDLTLKQARKSSPAEVVFKIYSMEYTPLLDKMRTTIESLSREVTKEADGLRGKETKTRATAMTLMIALMIVVVVSNLIMIRQSTRSIVLPLEKVMQQLEQESQSTAQTASEVAGASSQLSDTVNRQSSAIQETAASITEMSAMISKTANNAEKSSQVSSSSTDVANKGMHASQQIVEAIQGISQSNEEIMKQIDESNREIAQINQVIREIGEKTKVINDIVFQTRLLSFNASVEAARAGEQGKGFAVVAEEVGNLAQMSGKAAQEISKMLEGSISKVETIVDKTQRSVGGLMQQAKTKVQSGTGIALEGKKVLENILSEVKQVDGMVTEIATASKEQATGVKEIGKAMSELDKSTAENSEVSQKIAFNAQQMSSQAETLKQVVNDLRLTIRGNEG